MSFPIPDAALDDRLGFVGTAGAGKTYSAGTAIEKILQRKDRVIIPDALGVWWGLRLDSHGTHSGFDVVIFGGPHADIPITEHAGAIIGETVAAMKESAIVDLSGLGTKAAERRFMLAFLTALYRKASGQPVHLIFDEADLWAPQVIRDRDQEPAKLLGMMETIIRRGRVKGFIPWLITQRPAVVNKDVLSQIDGLVAFKLTSSHDRKAIGEWVKASADPGKWGEIDAALPAMQRGQAVVWVPGRGILSTEQFPAKVTFDSSRTPSRGEKVQTKALKPLDIGALRERLSTVEEDAKANDPAALRRDLAAARAEIAKLKKVAPTAAPADPAVADRAYKDGYKTGHEHGYGKGVSDMRIFVEPPLKDLREAIDNAAGLIRDLAKPLPKWKTSPEAVPNPPVRSFGPGSPKAERRIPTTSNGGSYPERLPPGELAVLVAAAQFGGVGREQLTVLTGYKRSSRDAYIQRLKEKGFISLAGQTVLITEAGDRALPPDYEPLPTGDALREFWIAKLPDGERRILEALAEAYPASVARVTLDEITGYKRSSRDAYLQRMKAKRLWTDEGGGNVRAAEALFQ